MHEMTIPGESTAHVTAPSATSSRRSSRLVAMTSIALISLCGAFEAHASDDTPGHETRSPTASKTEKPGMNRGSIPDDDQVMLVQAAAVFVFIIEILPPPTTPCRRDSKDIDLQLDLATYDRLFHDLDACIHIFRGTPVQRLCGLPPSMVHHELLPETTQTARPPAGLPTGPSSSRFPGPLVGPFTVPFPGPARNSTPRTLGPWERGSWTIDFDEHPRVTYRF